MLQVRSREGDDKRWFNPERDIAYAFPRTLRASMEAFNDFKGDDEVSLHELGQGCKVLGQVVQSLREGGATPEQVIDKLGEIPVPVMNKISRTFMYVFFGELVVWASQVRPKQEGDVPIDTEKLEEILGKFASGSAGHTGDADAQTAG